jgi:outer membrane protein assembly factor BamB
MMYYLPGDCTCSPFKGTFALVPESLATPAVPLETRFERGATAPDVTESNEHDWPTFLHDNSRGCAATTAVPTDGTKLWTAGSCEGVTPPVAASGAVFVGTRDHRVMAFDANDGSRKWVFTAGGSVEYPPTYYRGMCLFGSSDGWVYCLNAANGELIWRLHVAPYERKRVAFDRVESAWPVTTGVTIHEDTAYFFAGRLADFDGYHTVAADPRTGKVLWEQKAGSTEATMLSEHNGLLDFCNFRGGRYVTRINPKKKKVETVKMGKGVTPPRFAVGPSAEVHGKMARWGLPGRPAPSAHRLVLAGKSVFGAVWQGRNVKQQVFRSDSGEKWTTVWTVDIPDVRACAMILAGKALFLAGRGRALGEKEDGCVLRAFSTEDGTVLNSWKLDAPPVANGLAAAGGRLYLTTTDGKVRCFGK